MDLGTGCAYESGCTQRWTSFAHVVSTSAFLVASFCGERLFYLVSATELAFVPPSSLLSTFGITTSSYSFLLSRTGSSWLFFFFFTLQAVFVSAGLIATLFYCLCAQSSSGVERPHPSRQRPFSPHLFSLLLGFNQTDTLTVRTAGVRQSGIVSLPSRARWLLQDDAPQECWYFEQALRGLACRVSSGRRCSSESGGFSISERNRQEGRGCG